MSDAPTAPPTDLLPHLTPFQEWVLRRAARGLNQMQDCRSIAERCPGWSKRAARGALVAHVGRAGAVLQNLRLVWVLQSRDRFSTDTIAVRDHGEAWLAAHPRLSKPGQPV